MSTHLRHGPGQPTLGKRQFRGADMPTRRSARRRRQRRRFLHGQSAARMGGAFLRRPMTGRADARRQRAPRRADAVAERATSGLASPGPPAGPTSAPLRIVLTPQELHVAVAVAHGAANKEAAAALFLSVKTVEFHLSSAYRKLGLTSRSQLARVVALDECAGRSSDPDRLTA